MTRPLLVALHGVGSSARDMAAALAPLEQVAEVIALDGHERFDLAVSGRQWFSVAGVTEADRPMRVAGALPLLLDRLDKLAASRGVARDDLVLVGFSQGAIMTIAMIAQGFHHGRAVAIAGRLAAPVVPVGDRPAELLLLHDTADRVMPSALSQHTRTALVAAGQQVELTLTDGIGHGIARPTLDALVSWLAATAPTRATASIEGTLT